MSALSIFETNPEDFRVDIIHDMPKSGMWHCGPNPCWITITHLPTMTQARVYAERSMHTARAAAMDALEYMLADWRGEKCRFPENLDKAVNDGKETALSEMARLGQEWDRGMAHKHRLRALLGRVTDGTLSNAADDCDLINACFPEDADGYGMFETSGVTEAFSLIMAGSTDAAVAFVQSTLPGWGWMFGECHLSSDARVFPDFNSPTYGKRLAREFPQLIEGVEWSEFTDIDLRPAGNPARALLIAALTALVAI